MSRLDELIRELCPNVVEYRALSEVVDYEQPGKYIVGDINYSNDYPTPVLTAGQSFVLGYTYEETGIYSATIDSPVIIFDDFTTSFHWVNFSFKVKSSAIKILKNKDYTNVDFRFICHTMKSIFYVPADRS